MSLYLPFFRYRVAHSSDPIDVKTSVESNEDAGKIFCKNSVLGSVFVTRLESCQIFQIESTRQHFGQEINASIYRGMGPFSSPAGFYLFPLFISSYFFCYE